MPRCGLRVLSRRCSCLTACGGSIPPLLLGFSACGHFPSAPQPLRRRVLHSVGVLSAPSAVRPL